MSTLDLTGANREALFLVGLVVDGIVEPFYKRDELSEPVHRIEKVLLS